MDMIVRSINSEPVNLHHKFHNSPMLMLFYNNSCLGCTGRAIPFAYELQKEYEFLSIVGIHVNFNENNISSSEILSIFTAKESPFLLFQDSPENLYTRYNCEGTPHWILLKQNHHVFRSIFGSQHNAQNRLHYAIMELRELTT